MRRQGCCLTGQLADAFVPQVKRSFVRNAKMAAIYSVSVPGIQNNTKLGISRGQLTVKARASRSYAHYYFLLITWL
jgi:hypothetical protein